GRVAERDPSTGGVLDHELGDDEAALRIAAGTALRKLLEGARLETEGGHALEGALEADRVGGARRLRTGSGGGDEREVVSLEEDARTAERRRVNGLEGRPLVRAVAGQGTLPALLGGLDLRGFLLQLVS